MLRWTASCDERWKRSVLAVIGELHSYASSWPSAKSTSASLLLPALSKKEAAEDVVRGIEIGRLPRAAEKKSRKCSKECVHLLEYTDAREYTFQFNALTRLFHIASIREVPDREIGHAAFVGVQVLQWIQTLERSIQRRGHTSYAPGEFRKLLKLHADLTAALSGRWGS